MKARIIDGVGVAIFVAAFMVRVAIVKAEAKAHVAKPTQPTPSAPYTPPCDDPSIPWWAKLDCIWKA